MYHKLTRYHLYGRLRIDNNLAENAVSGNIILLKIKRLLLKNMREAIMSGKAWIPQNSK